MPTAKASWDGPEAEPEVEISAPAPGHSSLGVGAFSGSAMTPHESDEPSLSPSLDGYEWSQLRFALLAAGALVLGPLIVLGFRLANGNPP